MEDVEKGKKCNKVNKHTNNKMRSFTICFSVLVAGMLLMYGLIYKYPQQFSTIVTRQEKDVTITDTGIAESVDKVYDSVVIVSNYNNSSLVSTGTGFVYKTDGEFSYILTNAHVIADGNKVDVTFTNNKVVEVEVMGSNEYEDVAVLKVASEEIIITAEIGSSEDLRVGDTLFAIGSPLGNEFSWTVTRGILSGKDRMVEVSNYIMKVLQTDAAINSGNSGGPLSNANGEVIGINTLKLKETGVEGMGFAIPIEQAVLIADDIINGVEKENPYLGISMVDIIAAYTENFSHLEKYQSVIEDHELIGGIIIEEVVKNTTADVGGLLVGDIVTHFNGEEILSSSELRYELYRYGVGDSVTITVIRDGKVKEIELKLQGNQE